VAQLTAVMIVALVAAVFDAMIGCGGRQNERSRMTLKAAVFQISYRGGISRLLCINLPTLSDAVRLEAALNEQLRDVNVRLLGRFDQIEIARDLEEFMEVAAGNEFISPGEFERRMRRLMQK
jgi:hypothetical protein